MGQIGSSFGIRVHSVSKKTLENFNPPDKFDAFYKCKVICIMNRNDINDVSLFSYDYLIGRRLLTAIRRNSLC